MAVQPFSARRQILPTLDLRSQAEKQGVSSLRQTSEAIAGILKTLNQAEQTRRERQDLDTITRAVAGGSDITEAINSVAQQKRQFDPGIQGLLQRIGGAGLQGGVGQDLQRAIVGQKLTQSFKPKKAPTISEQRAAEASRTGTVPGTPEFERIAKGPKEQTSTVTQQKKELSSDIFKLDQSDALDTDIIQKIQDSEQVNKVLDRNAQFKKGSLDEIFTAEVKKNKNLQEEVGVKKFGIKQKDSRFGKKVYEKVLKDKIVSGAKQGLTPESIIATFNEWWDEQVEKEAGDTFKEFEDRANFQQAQDGTEEVTGLEKALEENKITQNEFDSITKGIQAGTITLEQALERIK